MVTDKIKTESMITSKTTADSIIPIKTAVLDKNGVQYIHSMIILQASSIIVFFIFAGKFFILGAGIYFSLALINVLVDIYMFTKIIPELANIRGTKTKTENNWEDTWDKTYMYMIIVLFATAGLDTGRFQWILGSIFDFISNIGNSIILTEPLISGIGTFISQISNVTPRIWMMIGICFYIFANLTLKWSMLSNKHFDNVVRINKDINHTVIKTGPYRVIRHPGYFGIIIFYISIPLILGSKSAILPALIIVGLFIKLTSLEDKLLKKELDGYMDYATKVRYRLIPGIW